MSGSVAIVASMVEAEPCGRRLFRIIYGAFPRTVVLASAAIRSCRQVYKVSPFSISRRSSAANCVDGNSTFPAIRTGRRPHLV